MAIGNTSTFPFCSHGHYGSFCYSLQCSPGGAFLLQPIVFRVAYTATACCFHRQYGTICYSLQFPGDEHWHWGGIILQAVVFWLGFGVLLLLFAVW